MKRIDYYLAGTIAASITLAIFGLVGILSIFTLLDQIEDIRNNYRIYDVLVFVLLSYPRLFVDTIPYAALIGCLAGLGIMANNSELIVMRAAGISTWSIAWSAMKPTLVLVVIGLGVGEYILPDIEQTARRNREKAMSVDNTVTSEYGFWYREGGIFMHFDEVTQEGVMEGVTHYEFDARNHMKRSLFAKRGVYHDLQENDKYWLLEDVTITNIKKDSTEVAHYPSIRWNTELTPELISAEVLIKPDKMSIAALDARIDYMQAQGLNSGKYELGFWRKILQPLATVALVFVAISFIFGPLRESTMGVRVVTGLVIGIVFKFLHDLLSPASLVFGFAPILAILMPILLCFWVGYVLLRRAG
jgi:lipopolysaccharide export system permease protein